MPGQGRRALGRATDEVDQPEPISPEPRHVLVVHEVLARAVGGVVLQPVPPHRQHRLGVLDDRHHVGQHDARGLTVLVLVLIAGHVHLDVDLQQQVPVVVRGAEPRLLILALLDLIDVAVGLSDIHVPVEPCVLEPDDLVLGLAHPVGDAWARGDLRGAVGEDDILSRHKGRDLPVHARVEVDLLERRPGDGQVPEHLLVLRAVLHHDLGQLVVHVRLHPLRSVLFLTAAFADDVGLHRARGRKQLGDGFALEPHDGFGQHGAEHAAGTRPRLGALLNFEAQQL